jgi:hypothetical protein
MTAMMAGSQAKVRAGIRGLLMVLFGLAGVWHLVRAGGCFADTTIALQSLSRFTCAHENVELLEMPLLMA